MRVEKVEREGKIIVITTLTDRKFLCIKLKPLERKFIATKEYSKGYWNWMELPNNEIVGDSLSFQLNAWLELDEIFETL